MRLALIYKNKTNQM